MTSLCLVMIITQFAWFLTSCDLFNISAALWVYSRVNTFENKKQYIIFWIIILYSLFKLNLKHMQPLSYIFLKLLIYFFFISWRLITLQYCSGFCHTLTWISHGFTCIPHPDPPSHLPLCPLPLGLPSAPGPSACLMHPTWVGDLFHPR